MNNEIIQILTPREYITTFLSKNLRIDHRELHQRRNFSYQFKILDSFSTSACALLGEGNKIISVMKSKNISDEGTKNKSAGILDIVIEKFFESNTKLSNSFSESNLLNFINKLIDDNLEIEIPCSLKFTLHITLINMDGNIYDCVANMIAKLFYDDRQNIITGDTLNKYLKIIKKFKTTTFCVIDDKLITDPCQSEVNISNYYFTIIKFDDDIDQRIYIHKISGDYINISLLEVAFNSI